MTCWSMWACQKRAKVLTLSCSRKNSEVKGITSAWRSCQGRKCVNELASSTHQLGTSSKTRNHKHQHARQLYFVSNQVFCIIMKTSLKDKITCLNSNYALSIIKKRKEKFPAIPSTAKNTGTELMSDKCKDYRVNKWTVLLPFKTHWICQHTQGSISQIQGFFLLSIS